MTAKKDLLQVIEVAYDLDAPDDVWLRQLAERVRPHIDQGLGLAAFEFRGSDSGDPEIVQRFHVGIPAPLEAIYPRVFETMDPAIRRRPFTLGPCVTGSQMMGQRDEFREQPHMKRYVHQFGMYDSFWVTAAEPSGKGCGFHAGRTKIAWATAAEVRRWGRVAGHITTALRLRQRLRASDAAPSPEAVLDDRGRIHDASGPAAVRAARELLTRAVLLLEKARGPLRESDPDQSLSDWTALVAGRWSLVDRFDADGRRYIVAHENEPRGPGPVPLTPRERQVVGYARLGHHNKLIAYELGIAESTVRVLIARAAAKLGVRTRDELLRTLNDSPP